MTQGIPSLTKQFRVNLLGGVIVFPSLLRVATVLGAMVGSILFAWACYGAPGVFDTLWFAALGWIYLNFFDMSKVSGAQPPWLAPIIHALFNGLGLALSFIIVTWILRSAHFHQFATLWPSLELGFGCFVYGGMVTLLSDVFAEGLQFAWPRVWLAYSRHKLR